MRLTQRSFACVKLHLQHTLLHGFEVTDELQEGLDLHVQLGGFPFCCSSTRGLVLLLQRNTVSSARRTAYIDMAVCRLWICLGIRAVVHEHHVVFSSYFLKCLALIPLILSFLKKPGEKHFKCLIDGLTKERTEKMVISITIVQLYFFLKKSLAFSRSAPHDVRLC